MSIVLSCAPFGLLEGRALFTDGFVSWACFLATLCNVGVCFGSTIAYAPNFRMLTIQACCLIGPPILLLLFTQPIGALALLHLVVLIYAIRVGRSLSADHLQQVVSAQLAELRTTELEHARQVAEEARQKAEQATRSRSEFLANISHEIRTPMNAVMGMTTLILDQDLPAETLDYVNVIRSSSDALLTIINDVLDFSKIESGKLDLEQEAFSLSDCVEEVLDLMANSAAAKQIELAADFQSTAPDWIIGDVTRVRQILLNLIGNAIKFTTRGEVVVTMGKRICDDGTEQLHIAVRDTGIGIAAEKIGKLFQSFSQADSSTTRTFGGTGLGLAISKRLTELMGGKIWAESQLGVGSIFQLTLPLRLASQPVVPPASTDWSGKRALLVDDNATNRLILTTYLAQWQLSPLAVASSAEALSALEKEHFDVAFLDWQMPQMDGAQLALAIKQRLGPSAPRMVMLTSGVLSVREAFGDLPNPLEALLTKPVRRSHLRRTLAQVFGSTSAAEVRNRGITLDHSLGIRMPLRILLADDNLVNQKIGVRLLERLGYQPASAGNGMEVLQSLRRQSYDLILMDVQMPEMDGIQAARHIRETWPPDERPRVIALTAGAMQENRADCLAAGMEDFLTKPINMAELEAALARCYQERKNRHALAEQRVLAPAEHA